MTEAVGCMIGGFAFFAAIIVMARFDVLLSAVTDEMRRDD